MTRKLQIQNFKGGVGKTTTAVNLSHGIALKDRRVLLIDLDQQGNASDMLGLKIGKNQPTLYNLMVDDLAYDQVIVDCPPALNVMHNNALLYSNELIIPIDMDRLALQGAKGILDSAAELEKVFKYSAGICGVLPTFIDRRTNITHQVMRVIESRYTSKVLPPIRSDAKLRQASAHGKTIFEYDSHSKGADDYRAVTEAIIAQEERAPMAEPAAYVEEATQT